MFKRMQRGYFEVIGAIYAVVILLGVGGWIANIVKIFHSNFDPFTAKLALRLIGILVAPLGAVMGYLS